LVGTATVNPDPSRPESDNDSHSEPVGEDDRSTLAAPVSSNFPETYRIATDLFLRLLGAVYLMAFASLWSQVDGLIGSGGILPVADFLEMIEDRLPGNPYWAYPTLCWVSDSDAFLHVLCGAGVTLAIVGLVLPYWTPLWVLLWALYLSLTIAGQTFLSFQWDILLLETGFLAVFLCPLCVVPRMRSQRLPSRIVVWLVRWLLFRFMLASGVVKLTAADPVWWDLTALTFHYFTQPLPPPTAWTVHHFSSWFHSASTIVMFVIELLVPFLIFLRWTRGIAFVCFVALQVVIIATGNYCFFNVLSIGLCLVLIADRSWPAPVRRWFRFDEGAAQENRASSRSFMKGRSPWLLVPVAAFLVIASVLPFERAFRVRSPQAPRSEPLAMLQSLPTVRQVLIKFSEWQRPFHLVNGYGLFANMTTERPEIIVEGSDDGQEWKAYEFCWKPGDPSRRPSFVAPHQPRLDWQMWFAALGNWQRNPWFVGFCKRLLEGSEPVLELLDENPFADGAPKYLRAVLYNYRFTTLEERQSTGDWWHRERRGLYLGPISLESFKPRKR
jgi:hypothetical protein